MKKKKNKKKKKKKKRKTIKIPNQTKDSRYTPLKVNKGKIG